VSDSSGVPDPVRTQDAAEHAASAAAEIAEAASRAARIRQAREEEVSSSFGGAEFAATLDDATREALFVYLLRLGDDRLVLGQRMAEWCGHAPILEEDIALANISLDLFGQASNLLKLAGEVEGAGRSEDDLAYFRDERAFRNVQLVELPRGDFALTIARMLLFAAHGTLVTDALSRSTFPALAGIAAKSAKEFRYHLRHAADWMMRLGDGTAESQARMQRALDELWRYTGELFAGDAVEMRLAEDGIGVHPEIVREAWRRTVSDVVARATLTLPVDGAMARGGRNGQHTEHLGRMLAEMQIVARSHPGARW